MATSWQPHASKKKIIWNGCGERRNEIKIRCYLVECIREPLIHDVLFSSSFSTLLSSVGLIAIFICYNLIPKNTLTFVRHHVNCHAFGSKPTNPHRFESFVKTVAYRVFRWKMCCAVGRPQAHNFHFENSDLFV